VNSSNFIPQDTMYLWWLGDSETPQLVGDIRLADRNRKVSLSYDAAWLDDGFALSEDLPLVTGEFMPLDKDCAAGAMDDARPDRWGERVIRHFEKTSRLSLMEFLYFAGDDRTGALSVSTSRVAYVPHPISTRPDFAGLDAMAEVVRKVLANEAVDALQQRLLRPGASLGGARPKSLMQMDGLQWIVKFSEGESLDTPLIEHATMTLAKTCGIQCAETRALGIQSTGTDPRHAVAVCRFDRVFDPNFGSDSDTNRRLHVVSANIALKAAGDELGYPELSQLLRRLVPSEIVKNQQEQLFKRMVFNILMDNTDDHEKNHALLRSMNGSFALSPAYDIVPSAQGLRYQQMRVGQYGSESTLENALSDSRQFSLSLKQAKTIVKDICLIVATWQSHFLSKGVVSRDIDELSQYIDGDFLMLQRQRVLQS
jgi:serine/threonine-protein kinase HipA